MVSSWRGLERAHLTLLRELADRGSVSAAAAATGRTPSAVSQQLKLIQRQVGVVLVERAGRGIRLTDAGQALADGAVAVLTAWAEAEAAWQAYRTEASGLVRIAFFHSAAELLVPGLLDRLRAYPGIALEFGDEDVGQSDFAPLTRDYDIVVAHRSDERRIAGGGRIEVVQLLREPLDVAVPLDHRAAGRASVAPADVINDDWIAPPEGFPIDRVLTAIAAHAGSPARVVLRTTHLPLMERLVAAGHGVALLPRYTTRDHSTGRFALVPLRDLRAGRFIGALARPDRAARQAVRVVLDELAAVAAGVTDPSETELGPAQSDHGHSS